MDNPPPPSITSFIIRFVVQEPKIIENGVQVYQHNKFYGAIRHIQSDQEMNFSRWDEAVKFIERFIHLDQNSTFVEDPSTKF